MRYTYARNTTTPFLPCARSPFLYFFFLLRMSLSLSLSLLFSSLSPRNNVEAPTPPPVFRTHLTRASQPFRRFRKYAAVAVRSRSSCRSSKRSRKHSVYDDDGTVPKIIISRVWKKKKYNYLTLYGVFTWSIQLPFIHILWMAFFFPFFFINFSVSSRLIFFCISFANTIPRFSC